MLLIRQLLQDKNYEGIKQWFDEGDQLETLTMWSTYYPQFCRTEPENIRIQQCFRSCLMNGVSFYFGVLLYKREDGTLPRYESVGIMDFDKALKILNTHNIK